MSKRLRRFLGGVCVTALLGGLAACGGSGDSDNASTTSAASTTATTQESGGTADLAYVKKQIDQYTGLPKFTPPGPAFDASKVAGKALFNIPYTSEVPFDQILDKAMEGVAKDFGMKYTEFPNQGQTSQWVQGVNQAISQKADVINFTVADPRVLVPQLQAAQKAGIKVVSTQAFGVDQLDLAPAPVTAVVPFPWAKVARLMADWAILDTKGKANILVVKSGEVLSAKPMVEAIQDEVDSYCGSDCKVTFVDVPVANWSSRIQPTVQASLAKDPDINYVIPVFDAMAQFVVPAIKAANRVGDVFVSTFNGTPFVLDMMQKEDIVRMDIGQSLDWTGWAAMDQVMRVLTGNEPLKEESIPLRVFTPDNVHETGSPATFAKGFGDDYVAGFKKLWSGK